MSGIRRGFILLGAGQGISILAGWGTHLVLARQLGAAGYGTYGVVLYVLSTIALILTAGIPEAIAKYVAEDPENKARIINQGFRLQVWFSVSVAAVYALASPLLARALNDPGLTAYLALSALAIPPIALHSTVIGAFMGQRRFLAQAITAATYAALRFALVVALVRSVHLSGAIVAFVVSPLLVIAVALPLVYQRGAATGLDSARLWRFAKPMIVSTVFLNVLLTFDVFLVKAIAEVPEHVGYYTGASTVARVPHFVFASFAVVLLPVVSSSGGGAETINKLISGPFRWIFLASLAAAAPAMATAPALLRILYGQEYVWADTSLALLVLSGTLFTQFLIIGYALSGAGQPGIATRLTLAGVAIQVAASLPLAHLFGAAGAAAASCVTALVLVALVRRAAVPHLGELLPLPRLLRASLAFLITIGVGALVVEPEPLHVLLAIPLALLNGAVLLAVGEVKPEELRALGVGVWRERRGTAEP